MTAPAASAFAMKYDTVIIGGGIMGSAAAYFLAVSGRTGRIAVIEPDPGYARATTPAGAGGVRRLMSRPENIRMSQVSLDFYADFPAVMATPGSLPLADRLPFIQQLD